MNIFEKLINWITKGASYIKDALTKGNAYVEALKLFTDSPIVQAIVLATPTKWDDGALVFVRKQLALYVTAKGLADKTLDEIKAANEDAHISTLNELSAMASRYKAIYDGGKLSIQQALAGAQVTYNEQSVLEGVK